MATTPKNNPDKEKKKKESKPKKETVAKVPAVKKAAVKKPKAEGAKVVKKKTKVQEVQVAPKLPEVHVPPVAVKPSAPVHAPVKEVNKTIPPVSSPAPAAKTAPQAAAPSVPAVPPAAQAAPAPVAAVPTPPPAPVPAAPAPIRPKISINETLNVKDLAEKMNLKVGDVLMKLLKMGTRASLNQRLDVDSATLLASEFGFDAVFTPLYSEDAMMKAEPEDASLMIPRPPIVTIMGHVDHGKTSLLDAIREAKVAEGEAGGITQHIGAYKVDLEKGSIVFLDTPGHEAFTAMRARGAQVTDIVVLVVAADDGVMPQTVEAIDHARAAGVPIIVAVNKIDLPQAKPDRVKQELSNYQLSPEEWGGKTIFVEVSAKKRMNLDKLLEMILLEAEILELKANPNRPAQCTVIEAKLDPKKGPVATLLVQKGTLKIGNTFVSGLTSGKVKAILDQRGHRVLEAGPSAPVEVLGFSSTPQVGERVMVVNSEKEAREISERRKDLSREASQEKRRHISLEMLSAIAKQGQVKVLNIVLKTDVQGSLGALKDSIEKLVHNEIRSRVIHSGVGGVNESDVSLAAASDAVIIGFNVRPDSTAEDLAKKEGVEVKTYRIIYEVIDDLRLAMEGLLEPEEKEVILGRVEVREVFKTPQGKVAGCMVVKGKISRSSLIRILRDSKIVHEGRIGSLRRFKDDVKEVEQGFDCGMSIEGYQDYNKGDVFEVFVKEKQARKFE